MGTTHEFHELVRCPECGEEFVRDISEGCFHHRVEPRNCPKCTYPASYYARELEKAIALKKGEKEPFNPSKRLR